MRRAWTVAWLHVLGGCGFEVSRTPDAQAAADAPLVCPASFVTSLPDSRSKYLVVANDLAWRAAESACELQLTHLFVPSSDAEVMAMRAIIGGDKYWVGIAQQPGQTTQAAGWLRVTGGPHTTAWAPGRPDDGGNEDGGEQAGAINNDGLDDENHRDGRRYICECDGIAVDAAIVAMLPP